MVSIWIISYVLLWFVVVLLALMLLSVLRNLGAIYEVIEARPLVDKQVTKLEVGQRIPELSLSTPNGEPTSLLPVYGHKAAIFIVHPDCNPCLALLQALAEGERVVDDLTIERRVIISIGSVTATVGMLRQINLPEDIILVSDTMNNTVQAWGIKGTPSIVIINAHAEFQALHIGYMAKVKENALIAPQSSAVNI